MYYARACFHSRGLALFILSACRRALMSDDNQFFVPYTSLKVMRACARTRVIFNLETRDINKSTGRDRSIKVISFLSYENPSLIIF